MGEIRPNHFHGGLDIKTDSRIGLPVLAAADGYVCRLKASAYGYGNVVYVQHPNGLVTVYGHLDGFGPKLAELVKREQYRRESFECEMFWDKPAGAVAFRQGELLAYSGNTGGSGGPHLHFEVRDKMERILNPLAFGGFPEIQDEVPPTFTGLAVRPLTIDGRVKDEFRRAEFNVKRLDATHFVVPDTIEASGTVGLEAAMYDRFSGADNHNGIQQGRLTVNGEPLFSYVIDGVPFSQQRMVSCHINYLTFKTTGRVFEKLYQDDGNALDFYQGGPTRGKLRLVAGRTYDVVLLVADSYGNTTELRATLRSPAAAPAGGFVRLSKGTNAVGAKKSRAGFGPTFSVEENILVLKASDATPAPPPLKLYVGRTRYDLRPSYAGRGLATYLYDLRGGLPDSVTSADGQHTLRPGFQAALPSGTDRSFSTPDLTLVTDPNSLFDTLYVQTAFDAKQGLWSVNSPLTPLWKPVRLTLKPVGPVLDPAHTAVYSLTPKLGFEGGAWAGLPTESGGAPLAITCNPKTLGRYKLLTDTIPPTATLVKKSPTELRFKISDNLSGIASFRCEVDGKWLLLRYEYKTATLFSERLDPKQPLRGAIRLRVLDAMGNERVVEGKL